MIGDRRTAALIAPDGTLCWLCLPDYDAPPTFGALLDLERGGEWIVSPVEGGTASQSYRDDTAVLATRWRGPWGELELTDAMAWPEDARDGAAQARRVVLRRLRCICGAGAVHMRVRPRFAFATAADVGTAGQSGAIFGFDAHWLGLWASFPLCAGAEDVRAELHLRAGEEAWAVLGWQERPEGWSAERAGAALERTSAYWRRWARTVRYSGPRRAAVRRSALTFHLLSFAPSGALVAAPTTSLPERPGGDRNYDYRYAWVRDTSLVLAILASLGELRTAERFMDWLAERSSASDMPLQVLYRIDGGTDVTQTELHEVSGYRGSRPVRIGNSAFEQDQIDSLGYFVDCALIYLEQGGRWKRRYAELVQRLADYTAVHWGEPNNGIWELPQVRHYVSSKVMSWVVLDRALKIAARTAGLRPSDTWCEALAQIRREVLERGWCERLGSFRQAYEGEELDASVLLMVLMDFLPADDPHIRATIERIAADLTVGGLVHRFHPRSVGAPGRLETFEGAFLPCTFWLAAAYAKIGRAEQAETILRQVEEIAGPLRLFAEEADGRARSFLGNTPLLFSHAEYVRAVMELAKARPLSYLRMAVGQLSLRLRRVLSARHAQGT